MNPKIIITEELLNFIFQEESKSIVGQCLKRLEIPLEIKEKEGKPLILNKEEIENLKSQIKNLLYESLRNIKKYLIYNGKEGIYLTKKEKK